MSVLWAVNMALGRILFMREDALKILTGFFQVEILERKVIINGQKQRMKGEF